MPNARSRRNKKYNALAASKGWPSRIELAKERTDRNRLRACFTANDGKRKPGKSRGFLKGYLARLSNAEFVQSGLGRVTLDGGHSFQVITLAQLRVFANTEFAKPDEEVQSVSQKRDEKSWLEFEAGYVKANRALEIHAALSEFVAAGDMQMARELLAEAKKEGLI